MDVSTKAVTGVELKMARIMPAAVLDMKNPERLYVYGGTDLAGSFINSLEICDLDKDQSFSSLIDAEVFFSLPFTPLSSFETFCFFFM